MGPGGLRTDVGYFDPVVEDWTEADQERERIEKSRCDLHLYVITPAMKGVFSIAEIIDSVHEPGVVAVFALQHADADWPGATFEMGQIKSLQAVGAMVRAHDADRRDARIR